MCACVSHRVPEFKILQAICMFYLNIDSTHTQTHAHTYVCSWFGQIIRVHIFPLVPERFINHVTDSRVHDESYPSQKSLLLPLLHLLLSLLWLPLQPLIWSRKSVCVLVRREGWSFFRIFMCQQRAWIGLFKLVKLVFGLFKHTHTLNLCWRGV